MALTERESEILDFIKKEVHLKGYPPSVREIGAGVGLSSSATVHGYLTRLKEKGYIRKNPTKSRSIEVLQTDDKEVPIRKGVPVPAIRDIKKGISFIHSSIREYFTIPEQLIPTKTVGLFVIKVNGNDMKNFGILDGDYIVAKQQQVALNGELVVVLQQNDQPTVRRFYKEKEGIYLTTQDAPETGKCLEDVFIIGKVLGVQRKF